VVATGGYRSFILATASQRQLAVAACHEGGEDREQEEQGPLPPRGNLGRGGRPMKTEAITLLPVPDPDRVTHALFFGSGSVLTHCA
jgi:hypothetical protein